MQLVSTGKLAEAESMLLDLEKADPRNPQVEYRFGLVLLKEGKLEEARLRRVAIGAVERNACRE